MKHWTIYCHIHVESGRRYIGLTQYTMLHRWNQHIAQAKNLKNEKRSHFAAAIRKYGKDAFSHEILAMSWDLEGANVTERIIIEQWDTRNPEIGFNLAKGGGSKPSLNPKNPWNRSEYRDKLMNIFSSSNFKIKVSSNVKGRILSSEVRSAISSRMIGHTKSLEVRSKLSSALKGHIMSEETCKKIAEARKFQIFKPETRKKLSQKSAGRRHTDESKIRMSIIQKQKADERVAGEKVRYRAVHRPTQTQTHKLCKKHGQIPLEECFSLIRNNIVYYECRLCRRFYTKNFKENVRKTIVFDL